MEDSTEELKVSRPVKRVHNKKNEIKLLLMFLLTFSDFLVEITVGYWTNSMALVADSFQMTSDVLSLFIAFLSIKLSQREWPNNTFGFARAQILGALVNTVFLFALCFSVVINSVQRFAKPETTDHPKIVLYVGSAGLVVNLIGLLMFHQGHGETEAEPPVPEQRKESIHGSNDSGIANEEETDEKARKEEKKQPVAPTVSAASTVPIIPSDEETGSENGSEGSSSPSSASTMNVKGVFLVILADALGSVVVITSALVIWLTDWEYNDYVDPTLSIVVVVIICYSAFPLFKDSAKILLQNAPGHMCMKSLESKILERVDQPVVIHDLHVWQLTGNKVIGTVHVIHNFESGSEDVLLAQVTKVMREEGISSVTVQLERLGESEKNKSFLTEKERCIANNFK